MVTKGNCDVRQKAKDVKATAEKKEAPAKNADSFDLKNH